TLLAHEMAMIDVTLDRACRPEHQMGGVDGSNHLAQDHGVLGYNVSLYRSMLGQLQLPATDLTFDPAREVDLAVKEQRPDQPHSPIQNQRSVGSLTRSSRRDTHRHSFGFDDRRGVIDDVRSCPMFGMGPQVAILEVSGKVPKRPDEEIAVSRTAPRFVKLTLIRLVEC